MTKEIVCLRPQVGDEILSDNEEFLVNAVALQAGEPLVLVKAAISGKKRLSKRVLTKMGFSPS